MHNEARVRVWGEVGVFGERDTSAGRNTNSRDEAAALLACVRCSVRQLRAANLFAVTVARKRGKGNTIKLSP